MRSSLFLWKATTCASFMLSGAPPFLPPFAEESCDRPIANVMKYIANPGQPVALLRSNDMAN